MLDLLISRLLRSTSDFVELSLFNGSLSARARSKLFIKKKSPAGEAAGYLKFCDTNPGRLSG